MMTLEKHHRGLTCSTHTASPSHLPFTYCIHVGQLLSHQVGIKRQEVLLDLDLNFFVLPQAERTVAVETS